MALPVLAPVNIGPNRATPGVDHWEKKKNTINK